MLQKSWWRFRNLRCAFGILDTLHYTWILLEDPLSSQEQQYLSSHQFLFANKRKSQAFFHSPGCHPKAWVAMPTGIATAFQTPRSKQLSLSWVAVGESTSAEWTEGERGGARGDTGCWWPDNLGILPTGEGGNRVEKEGGLVGSHQTLAIFSYRFNWIFISIPVPSPIGVFFSVNCFSFVGGEAGQSELGLGTASSVVTYWWSTCLVSQLELHRSLPGQRIRKRCPFRWSGYKKCTWNILEL